MSTLTAGLVLFFLFHLVFLGFLVAVVLLFPKCFLAPPARAVLNWLPPFLGGAALRDWAARAAERMVQKRLAASRTNKTADQLAAEVEDAAMEAMLPLSTAAERDRVVACPETGQGLVGITAPEAIALASYIRKHKSRAEQERIYELAVANAEAIASRSANGTNPYPCALQGKDHVCCAFAQRPLRCRPLHAIEISRETAHRNGPADAPDTSGHERIVAQGIEMGTLQALKSAGLDANLYELNSALATALETPDAAERWAQGEKVFRDPLREGVLRVTHQ